MVLAYGIRQVQRTLPVCQDTVQGHGVAPPAVPYPSIRYALSVRDPSYTHMLLEYTPLF